MIKLLKLKGNLSKIDLNDIIIYFSYETPIAIEIKGELFVSKNIWSNTTGTHLGEIKRNKEFIEVENTELNNIIGGIKWTY